MPRKILGDHDPVLKTEFEKEDTASGFDSLCMLYVGMTRAKHGLYLVSSTGKSKSSVVREALEAYLNGETARDGGSCLDLVENLAGCLEGPRDLSSNKKHMSGFGR